MGNQRGQKVRHSYNRFIHEPSQLELAAIRALMAVRDSGGDVARVFASVQSPILEAHRAERLKPTRVSGARATATWLCGRRPKCGERTWKAGPLAFDHTSFWQDRRTGERVIITEPYHIGAAEILCIADQMRQHGIKVSITASSPWFPGATVAVEYRRPPAYDGQDCADA